MADIDEIAPDIFRISIHVPQFDLQFNHFLVKDDEPLLFHTGMRGMFPDVRDGGGQLIDPASLRWISWSHFEVDECGALNEWLAVAPRAQAACGEVGAMVNVQDFAVPPSASARSPDEILADRTASFPMGANAAPAARVGRRSVVRREHDRVLFCSDLFHQLGEARADHTQRRRRSMGSGRGHRTRIIPC